MLKRRKQNKKWHRYFESLMYVAIVIVRLRRIPQVLFEAGWRITGVGRSVFAKYSKVTTQQQQQKQLTSRQTSRVTDAREISSCSCTTAQRPRPAGVSGVDIRPIQRTLYRWYTGKHLMRRRTRSSAIAERPRDASCQLKSCQLPRNSAETTCTTSLDPSISCR